MHTHSIIQYGLFDPDGMENKDWVKDKDNNVRWDKNANSQAATKKGETYIGKTLIFKFNSFIDANSWDGLPRRYLCWR